MKVLSFILFILLVSPFAFSQISVDCKISASYELIADYDVSSNSILVTKKENEKESKFAGVSFEQVNKDDLNRNADLIDLAKKADIPIERANSANRFVIQKSNNASIELVDFISIDAESIGLAANLGGLIQKCN